MSAASSLQRILAHPALHLATGLELGVSTSSLQSEGGLNGPGEPHNHWSAWESERRVERSGASAGLWGRYPAMARRAQSLGLSRVRVSLEWARLAPSGESVSATVANAYAKRLTVLHAVGVKTIVTLAHFSHPAWAGADPWLDERAPELFARYAVSAVRAVNLSLVRAGVPPLDRLLTHNEPNMLALGTYLAGVFPHREKALADGSVLGLPRALRALDHLLAGHVLAHDRLHELYAREAWPTPDVSTNINILDLYSVSKGLGDLLRAPALGVSPSRLGAFARDCSHRFYADLFMTEENSPRAEAARAIDSLAARVAAPEVFARTLGVLYRTERHGRTAIDHLAVDLYDPFTLHQLRGGEALLSAFAAGRGWLDLWNIARETPDLRLAEPWDWHAEPAVLVRVLRSLTYPRPSLPIDIDENGMAIERPQGAPARPRADGVTRVDFLRRYLTALLEARVVHQLPVRAYLYWTLVDNYELGRWAPRFGLYGLGDPLEDGTAPVWMPTDAAGDDAAAVLGGFARAVSIGQRDVSAMRAALAVTLCPSPSF